MNPRPCTWPDGGCRREQTELDAETRELLEEMEAALRADPPLLEDTLTALYRASQDGDSARWAGWLRNARVERERAAKAGRD